ncbi:hypothetical protein C8Q76DRAFT_688302 [Earliella scabrosa]|nr:hypothetical protein C8Q76DRAFT_688302 [Earliella scabrosa]
MTKRYLFPTTWEKTLPQTQCLIAKSGLTTSPCGFLCTTPDCKPIKHILSTSHPFLHFPSCIPMPTNNMNPENANSTQNPEPQSPQTPENDRSNQRSSERERRLQMTSPTDRRNRQPMEYRPPPQPEFHLDNNHGQSESDTNAGFQLQPPFHIGHQGRSNYQYGWQQPNGISGMYPLGQNNQQQPLAGPSSGTAYRRNQERDYMADLMTNFQQRHEARPLMHKMENQSPREVHMIVMLHDGHRDSMNVMSNSALKQNSRLLYAVNKRRHVQHNRQLKKLQHFRHRQQQHYCSSSSSKCKQQYWLLHNKLHFRQLSSSILFLGVAGYTRNLYIDTDLDL